MKHSLSSQDFKRVLQTGILVKFNTIKFSYKINFKHNVGFTVSKKYGNAVSRNLFKRRCRTIYNEIFIDKLYDCAVIITPMMNNINYKQIAVDCNKLIEHINDK